jgi:hypothetical protein
MSSSSASSISTSSIPLLDVFIKSLKQTIKIIEDIPNNKQNFYDNIDKMQQLFHDINTYYYNGTDDFIKYFMHILSTTPHKVENNSESFIKNINNIIYHLNQLNNPNPLNHSTSSFRLPPQQPSQPLQQSSQPPSQSSQSPLPSPPLSTDQQQVTQHPDRCTYYNTTPQEFIFPPCFLKNKLNTYDNTFFDQANLNMIIFELLIKLVDFMHDNVKDIDRIRNSDEIIFDMFARKKKATKAKALQSSKKIGGMLTDDNTSSSNILSSSSSKILDSSSLYNQQPYIKSTPTPTLLKLPSSTYNVASIKNVTNTNTENKNVKDQFPYVYYEMDDLFSIYINKILALLSPELLEYIANINGKIKLPEEKNDKNKKFDENEEPNTILFSSIIYIINVLITPYTGEYENNMYLTNFTIKYDQGGSRLVVDGDINEDINGDVNEDINGDVNESDKSSSFGVKICKKAIMQSFIDIFLNNNGTGQSTNFFEILQTNYYTIYDKFIDYVEIYFCNELCLSNDTTSQYGGGISIQKVVEIVKNSSPKSGGGPKIINNIIIRLYVITLLKEFKIVKPLEDSNNYLYEYTDFGNAIYNGDSEYYAVNYQSDKESNIQAPHLSLVILRDILGYFNDIVENNVNETSSNSSKFNKDFKKFEDNLWKDLYFLSSTIPDFYLKRVECKQNIKTTNKEKCCANKFVISNASTTVNLNEGNSCIFNSLASVLDPAGSTNINMNHDNYEYGNIDCFVYGANNDSTDIQKDIYFNGKIDFLETQPAQGNKTYYLSNKSQNKINDLNVRCSIQVDYEKDGNTDVYTEIKKDDKKISTSRYFGTQPVEVPQSTELSSTRKQMTYNLLNALGKTYPLFRNQISSTIYTKSLYDPKNKNYVEGLFGSTLNKTVGDLMQILTSLIKYGGITSFPTFLTSEGFHSSVIGFNDQGNALREINHHDLTASIINLFMLIFGSYTFDMQEGSSAKYYTNLGKNEGSYMADHRTTFMGFGTTENIHNTIVEHNNSTSDCNISNLKIVKITDFEKQKNLEKEAEDLKKEVENLKKELANSRAPPIVEVRDSLSSIKSDSSSMELSNENPRIQQLSSSESSSESSRKNQNNILGKRGFFDNFYGFFKKPKGGKTNKIHYIKKHKTSIKNGNKIKQNKKSLKNNKHKKNSNTYKNK